MKSTLSEILEVEKNARLRTDEAGEYRSRIVDDAEKQRAEIIDESIKAASEKVVSIRAQLERRAEEKAAALNAANEQALAQLEKASGEKLDAWADELYRRVLTGE